MVDHGRALLDTPNGLFPSVDNTHSLFSMQGSVFPFAVRMALIPSLAALGLKVVHNTNTWHYAHLLEDMTKMNAAAFTSFTTLLGFLIVFRTSFAYSRFNEGLTVLHEMGVSIVDSASSLAAFTIGSKCPQEEIRAFTCTIVTLFSILHGCCVVELHGPELTNHSLSNTLAITMHELDDETRRLLESGRIGRTILYHWVVKIVLKGVSEGIVTASGPMVNAAFVDLSRAMRSCEKGKKTITPFPFPYEQTIMFLLMMHWLLIPVVVCGWTTRPTFAFLFTFIILTANWSLYQIAAELEHPFGDDPNDIDTRRQVDRVNKGLLAILSTDAAHVPYCRPGQTKPPEMQFLCDVMSPLESEDDTSHELSNP